MPISTAAEYFDRMRAQEDILRHRLPQLGDIDLAGLPYTAQMLAREVGLPAALALVDGFGGITLRIPMGETAQGKAMLDMLAKCMGREGAIMLSRRYAGTSLYVPTCKLALLKARDAALVRDRYMLAGDGLSERDIVACLAVRYQISDRHVWTILKKPEATERETRQASLL